MKFIKKHLKLLILIIVCFLIYIIYQNNNQNVIYLTLGDGLSLGKDSYGQINYGYSDYLYDYYTSSNRLNYYTKAFSSSEESIISLYEKLVINERVIADNTEINLKQMLRESSVLTISIGLNDLKYKLSIMENITSYKIDKVVQETYNSFEKLLKEIRKYYHHKIYIIGYYEDKNNLYLTKAIKKLNNYYSNNKKIIYIDTFELFAKNNDYLSNPSSYYPNNKGYKAIFTQIKKKLP